MLLWDLLWDRGFIPRNWDSETSQEEIRSIITRCVNIYLKEESRNIFEAGGFFHRNVPTVFGDEDVSDFDAPIIGFLDMAERKLEEFKNSEMYRQRSRFSSYSIVHGPSDKIGRNSFSSLIYERKWLPRRKEDDLFQMISKTPKKFEQIQSCFIDFLLKYPSEEIHKSSRLWFEQDLTAIALEEPEKIDDLLEELNYFDQFWSRKIIAYAQSRDEFSLSRDAIPIFALIPFLKNRKIIEPVKTMEKIANSLEELSKEMYLVAREEYLFIKYEKGTGLLFQENQILEKIVTGRFTKEQHKKLIDQMVSMVRCQDTERTPKLDL